MRLVAAALAAAVLLRRRRRRRGDAARHGEGATGSSGTKKRGRDSKGRGGKDRPDAAKRRRDDLLDRRARRSDRLNGGPGDDDLSARRRRQLRDGPGFDDVDAGRATTSSLAQRREDRIDCGAGVDTAVLDETEDGVFDCEVLGLPPEPEPEPRPQPY